MGNSLSSRPPTLPYLSVPWSRLQRSLAPQVMGGFEGLIASVLCDRSDPTRLTGKEIKDEFGSLENFVRSYGLKPYEMDDLQEALSISRSLKESREWHKRHGH